MIGNLVPGTPIRADSSTSAESSWQTPQWLLERLRRDVFRSDIDLDPCTTYSNPVRAKYIYTAHEDGLAQPWVFVRNVILRRGMEISFAIGEARTIFVNPPFINASEWANKSFLTAIAPQAPRLVFLGPAAVGTVWFHEMWERADDALFLRQRIRYEGGVTRSKSGKKTGPTRGTALFAFNGTLRELRDFGTRAIAA